ncbi:SpvB/TcaC N-terminal domain-containing protein [Chitinophaga skermanii]|nr:SpvB/TcaC N-terminal domain-containing protein [Chitinophaga skermanii]
MSTNNMSKGLDIPTLQLPQGGGPIKGIDEKFSVNPANGTAAISYPIPIAQARGAVPALQLSYNSGNKNSIFGLGWDLSISSIKRKTDKGLPLYDDANDSDTFLLTGAEDLVPVFQQDAEGNFIAAGNGHYVIKEHPSADQQYIIRYYRPRVEQTASRIERWTHVITQETYWRMISSNNVTTLFGYTANERIADPENPLHVYEWLPSFMYDDKGNCAQYIYKKEDNAGFDAGLPQHLHRHVQGQIQYTNSYLSKLLYGNKTPYLQSQTSFPPANDYCFETIFDYGEYNSEPPFDPLHAWHFRIDAFSTYKPGFEVRTTRLCKRILQVHHFAELPGGSAVTKSLDIAYESGAHNGISLLSTLTTCGYIKQANGTYTSKAMPPTAFIYEQQAWDTTIRTIENESQAPPLFGINDSFHLFTDLYNEGLPGILTERGQGWYYKQNLGGGQFSPSVLVSNKPNFTGLGAQLQLTDLDADGNKQLAQFQGNTRGFFELNDQQVWQRFQTFEQCPNIDLSAPNVRMIDLNGDGKADICITEEDAITWYPSAGKQGFEAVRSVFQSMEEERKPQLVSAETVQTIFLADMNGDGLTDIVRIRNGEVCYWPNVGHGKFGAKVVMAHAPTFDDPSSFQPKFIQLADFNGSGTMDILYSTAQTVKIWLNNSGNEFDTTPVVIAPTPKTNLGVHVNIVDLLGTGLPCLVWSSNLPSDVLQPIQYINLMQSKFPYLLRQVNNNFGKELHLSYEPSTKYYLADLKAGEPWLTKLPFVVPCLDHTTKKDRITGAEFTTYYRYHHGFFDHAEREFRGFGMVEQIDGETYEHWVKNPAHQLHDERLHQAPVLTKTWIHHGASLQQETILQQYENSYWPAVLSKLGIDVPIDEYKFPTCQIVAGTGIPNTQLQQLSPEEWQQAHRAFKGHAVRTEIFAPTAPTTGATLTQLQQDAKPYSVSMNHSAVELIQPKGQNTFAVFRMRDLETIQYQYEQHITAPRIMHQLNLAFDDRGNVLSTASIAYPRRVVDTSLPLAVQAAQAATIIQYNEQHFTQDIDTAHDFRLRVVSESKGYDIKGLPKAGTYYTPTDFTLLAIAQEIDFLDSENIPPNGVVTKRLTHHQRQLFRGDDGRTILPLHSLAPKGMPYETYQLTFTSAMATQLYGNKVNDTQWLAANYVHSEQDQHWWSPSGRMHFIAEDESLSSMQQRFYRPYAFTDAMGATTITHYDESYQLWLMYTEDAIGNRTSVTGIDYYTLLPNGISDINDNISQVLFDELGLVKAVARLGKGNEADDLNGLFGHTLPAEYDQINAFFTANDSRTLQIHASSLLHHASMRYVYDFNRYMVAGQPAVVAGITREQYYHANPQSPVKMAFEYMSGLGYIIMQKSQAAPGIAKHVSIEDGEVLITTVDTSLQTPTQLRWIGDGRLVMNNKGNMVKKYEPYYATSFAYEAHTELVEVGVTPLFYYDAQGRVVKTILPNQTFSYTNYSPWQSETFDPNDTVLESAWYNKRVNRLIDTELIAAGKDPAQEQSAAMKAALHAHTPNIQYVDTLGRTVVSEAQVVGTKGIEKLHTTNYFDSNSNLLRTIDARNNTVVNYTYNLLGTCVHVDHVDTGEKWSFFNVNGQLITTWDDRNFTFLFTYDTLHRPLKSTVMGGDGETALHHVFDAWVYGEGLINAAQRNMRGQIYQHFDTAGVTYTDAYSFLGNPLATHRRLYSKFEEMVNWHDDVEENEQLLEPNVYTFATQYDALGRITEQLAPCGTIITPVYDEGGLLTSESATHLQPAVTRNYVQQVTYNEKGRRSKILYGNNTSTRLFYDETTFLISRIVTARQDGDILQDWRYTYDPVGNITHITDHAVPTTFAQNQPVTATNTFTYDALYRIVEATGRENNAALTYGLDDNWQDAPFLVQLNPADPMMMRNYVQQFAYDEVGNITQMKHQATGNNWVRGYTYHQSNNRLLQTQVGTQTYQYGYNTSRGHITDLPHLQTIVYDCQDRVCKTSRQRRVDGGVPETTYYQYDSSGRRIRKITLNTAAPGHTPTKKEERVYVAGYELYIQHSGSNAGLQRESLSLVDGDHRFVRIETRNEVNDGTLQHIARYQFTNHLGAACLELDHTGNILSYEEYHPFGTTAYQAVNKTIKTATKQYRFSGMERDEESGLSYHTARYYMPWLGRWLSSDPIGTRGGINSYAYCNNAPLTMIDPGGCQGMSAQDWGFTLMQERMGQELGAMWESVFGGKAQVNIAANRVSAEAPKGGVGGAVGGIVRTATFRLVPIEKDASMASLMGMEMGAGLVPILDPAERLASGVTVTGQETSRTMALIELALDVGPWMMELKAARAAKMEAKLASRTAKLELPIGSAEGPIKPKSGNPVNPSGNKNLCVADTICHEVNKHLKPGEKELTNTEFLELAERKVSIVDSPIETVGEVVEIAEKGLEKLNKSGRLKNNLRLELDSCVEPEPGSYMAIFTQDDTVRHAVHLEVSGKPRPTYKYKGKFISEDDALDILSDLEGTKAKSAEFPKQVDVYDKKYFDPQKNSPYFLRPDQQKPNTLLRFIKGEN